MNLRAHLCALAIALAASLAPVANLAHAGVLENFAENKIVDAVFRAQSLGAPATWYVGLHTTTCTEGSAETEVSTSGTAYGRASVAAALTAFAGTQSAGATTASTGTNGTTSNNATVSFSQSTAAWGNLQSVGFYDAVSAGNQWICIDLTAAFNVSGAGVTVSFPAGALQFQIDN